MSTAQKVIKYLAIVFGIFLSVSIISGIVIGVLAFTNIFLDNNSLPINIGSKSDKEINVTKYYEKEFDVNEVKYLNIEVDISKFNIEIGEKLSIKAYNVYDKFSSYVENNTLVISEDMYLDKKLYKINSTPNITLYVPEEFKFDSVVIKSGVGNVDIKEIATNKLEVNIGTGNFGATNIIANKTKFQGGVGELNITNSNLGKLEFKAGVGDSKIETKLNNDTKIESGVGNVTLTLLDEKENYYFDIETGLGNIILDGVKVKNGTFGDKEAKNVNIKGGIGNIKIKF